ncbi:3-oxo-tetronate kinase [Methylovirgula sp. 4M-Z18]|uniref:3-oxo-tetronate kinase n=1 Tax=Methylovirgula sp. 4M-Z18 TaxID=2293567 RepID=UPI000E2F77EB|nr:3-oxo-tetronate kinase [Methylovirgula sp. 4M-Z18]RFB76548.1 four-carbon acid sugar kinase family protein [Methylovirgula sp. 4M-Z18]
MTILVAAIADDYTGASDLANTWRKAGFRTVQTIGIPSSTHGFTDIDALVVSLKIRSVPASEAVAAALNADAFLRGLGVPHVMYKICSTFDSTDDGNIGHVTEALRANAGADWALISPAFPETGRTVYKGHLFVADTLLNESPLKDHPLNPMRDANLVRVLSRQTKHPVYNVDFQTMNQGALACHERIKSLPHRPCSIIADAISQNDLDILGELAISNPVSTGASGLGAGIAHAILQQHSKIIAAKPLEPVAGYAAVLAGSCSARTLEQIAAAELHMPTFKLDPDQLIASNGNVETAIGFARQHIGTGPFLIAASSSPDTARAVQQRHGKLVAGQVIEAALADIAARLVAMGVKRLVVAGGETSGAIVDRLGIESFEVGDELAAGVPVLRSTDPKSGNLMMVLKSGNFGGTNFFHDALVRMK